MKAGINSMTMKYITLARLDAFRHSSGLCQRDEMRRYITCSKGYLTKYTNGLFTESKSSRGSIFDFAVPCCELLARYCRTYSRHLW